MKKVILVGLILAAAGFAYSKSSKSGSNSGALDPTDRGFTIQLENDPTGGVYVVLGNRKFAFTSEAAFLAYGYSQPRIVGAAEFAKYPAAGFVAENGQVIQQAV